MGLMCVSTNTTYTDSISYYWDVTIDDIVKICEGNLPAANNCQVEFIWWKRRWSFRDISERPQTIVEALKQCDSDAYPNLLVLRKIDGTIAVTSWEFEHSSNIFKVHSQSETNFGSWKLFKNDEKGFLFHVNSSFCSQDIQVFVLTFWSCSKTAC